MKRFLLFTLLVVLPVGRSFLSAQEYIYKNFTTSDGLPSSEVYHVYQDSKGYIWFATDNGASRYNGYEFQNFDINDGLAENEISEIYEDNKGQIWFIGITGKLTYYANQQLFKYEYNKKLSLLLPENPVYLKSNFYIDGEENVYISIKGYDLFKIDKDGKVLEYKDMSLSRNTLNYYELPNQVHLLSIKNKNFGTEEIPFDLLLYKTPGNEKMISLPNSEYRYPHHLFMKWTNDSSFWLSAGTKIYYIQNHTVQETIPFKDGIVWMSGENKNELFICHRNEGAINYKVKDNQLEIKNQYLKGYTVTSVLKDNFGSYWFSTLNNGVFQLNSERYQVYNQKSGLLANTVNCIAVKNDTIYAGFNKQDINIITREAIKTIKIQGAGYTPMKALLFDKENDQLALGAIENFYILKNKQLKVIKRSPLPDNVRYSLYFNSTDIISDHDGGFWLSGGTGFFRIKYGHVVFDSNLNTNFKIRVNSIFLDENNTLWLGCNDGLWEYKNGNLKYHGNEFEELQSKILDIKKYDQTLILATKGKGLLFFNGKAIKKLTKNEGLSANLITSLAIQNNTLWAGSLNGLNKINLKNENDDFQIEESTRLSGFEIYQIKASENKLTLATNKGLVIRNTQLTEKTASELPFHFTSFSVNGEKREVLKNYGLLNKQNNISIRFEALNYATSTPIEYKYRLEGLDTNWFISQKREANYYNLQPGKYRFVVQVKNTNGNWGQKHEFIHIAIAPAYWQTMPFKTAVFLIISMLFILIFARRKANERKKTILERKVYNYKLKTLWGQMKPHFIFNTLNSINNYIISNEALSASKYLTKFSVLIRKILDYTQHETISLDEELETLELYMKIEEMRLKQKFSYSIFIDDEIDKTNTQVPGMILQPFVENSIWHGIQPLDRKGTIKIKVLKKENNLIIEIIDNGIGREKANEANSENGFLDKPHGAKIARERLNIFANRLNKRASIEYIDLKTKLGVIGTKVKITIPLINRTKTEK